MATTALVLGLGRINSGIQPPHRLSNPLEVVQNRLTGRVKFLSSNSESGRALQTLHAPTWALALLVALRAFFLVVRELAKDVSWDRLRNFDLACGWSENPSLDVMRLVIYETPSRFAEFRAFYMQRQTNYVKQS